jgi:DNA-binding NtrC family response regulator
MDDDLDLSQFLRHALTERGYKVECLESAERAPDLLAGDGFDLVLLDNRMPGMSGIEFLAALQQRGIRLPVIVMTSHGSADTAIQATHFGAFDYVVKPLTHEELDRQLAPLIAEALETVRPMPSRVRLPGEAAEDDTSGAELQGDSRAMQEVYKLIGRVAKSDDPVLIRGETGTGKELVARAIHSHSPRKRLPFVAMNCTALNENLLDDELFGHEPGAFTGGEKLRKGRFEHANGGTLFLDEVGDMPLPLQAKLLRVLERQEVTRVGGNEAIQVNVRLVSATHRDLETAIRDGSVRQDLFYRINGATIRLPQLRERGSDLRLLTELFVARAIDTTGRPLPTLHETAWEKLLAYSWPGNIRQLQYVIRHAVRVCRGSQIMPADIEFGDQVPGGKGTGEDEAIAGLERAIRWALSTGRTNLYRLLHDMLERELLKLTLTELDGNQAQVAKRLGIARNTMRARIHAYGLDEKAES